MGLGVVVIGLDVYLARRQTTFRLPVLAVALGMYLPLKLSATIMFGGLLAEYVKTRKSSPDFSTEDRGLLFAAGLVTGEALIGILLAVPITLSSVWPSLSEDLFQLFVDPPLGGWPGLAVLTAVGWCLLRVARSTGSCTTGDRTTSDRRR
ncbi:MAG: OPT/YSL family transporter [Nitrospira sp.]|nr:OPT/YSL family transporter [Nitrospira sp.]